MRRLPVRVDGTEGMQKAMTRPEAEAWAKRQLAKGETFSIREDNECWVITFRAG